MIIHDALPKELIGILPLGSAITNVPDRRANREHPADDAEGSAVTAVAANERPTKGVAAQPVAAGDGPLSPWWIRAMVIVMVLGFSGLVLITTLSYHHAPPIPARIVDAHGALVFSADNVSEGPAVFLRYGLMTNGSIWGHGAYLGPEIPAVVLHRIGLVTAKGIAQERYGQASKVLTPSQAAAVQTETGVSLKTNRYDESSGLLQLTAAQAAMFEQEIAHWTDYFHEPSRNGGLKADLITDPTELRQFTAFVTWAAWASVAARPGQVHPYTNNFPYDTSVGNVPIAGALLWSALSLMVLLAGVATVLLAFGKFDCLAWITRGHNVKPKMLPGRCGPGQNALVKFVVVVALLFLAQSLLGIATAHYRADPGSFYGLQLERIFPGNLLRTWHLQLAIFWIALACVAAALFWGRSLRTDKPRWLAGWTHVLFAAFALVIFGTLLTPNHGHAAMMGVFGMLAIALMVFVLRQTSSDAQWPGIEKYVRCAYSGTNVGLAMMVLMSLFPGGLLQVWDVLQNGYRHVRSLDYIGSERSHLIEWLRLPGDVVFIVFGAAPLVIATIKCYFNLRAAPAGSNVSLGPRSIP